MTEWTVRDAFEEGGIFAKKLEGYELRQPQLDLSLAIGDGMADGHHLAAEGPTGTGKSLAYLVPAIRQVLLDRGTDRDDDDCRVVVATANIALQEQLFFKDLPFLEDALPDDFRYALVKGRNNYLCRDQLNTFKLETAQGALAFGKDATQVELSDLYPVLRGDERTICEWSERTETGDKSELEIVPANEVWRKFSVTADECLGSSCPFSDECFANQARKALQAMDVIVVNYHLLFAALKVRMDTGKDIVLPSFKFLVCDEAHKVADIARDFFGWTISKWTITRATNRFQKAIRQARRAGLSRDDADRYGQIGADVLSGMEGLWASLEEFYADSRGALRIRQPDSIRAAGLSQAMGDMGEAFLEMSKLALGERDKADVAKYGERAIITSGELREAMTLDDDNGVYFTEPFGKNKQLRLVKRLLYVGDMLWGQMFERTDSTVITSATLAIEGNCSYIRDEVGMKDGQEIIVDSPFDFRKQACIVLSEKAPDPKRQDYPERVAKVMAAIIEQAGGRTLGLFTSYRVLRHAAEYLRSELPQFRFLVQGEQPRMKLVKEFKEDVASVLLGTESFWAGVDVPGEALSCLVIDKIPFPSPGDPVLDALSDKANGQGFWKVSVPRAVLQFRQGAGRLIRRKDDRGVIVVLDNRLVTKGYGSIFTKSLPRMTRARGIREGQVHHWLNMEA
jgi:ATP-dependent DNA helicase DinG